MDFSRLRMGCFPACQAGAAIAILLAMAGVGKLLKQAQKMQKAVEALQADLAQRVFEVSAGGGAVVVKVNGQQDLVSLKVDPEFLKEEASIVEETLLEAIRDAMKQSKAAHEEEMGKITGGFQLPGF